MLLQRLRGVLAKCLEPRVLVGVLVSSLGELRVEPALGPRRERGGAARVPRRRRAWPRLDERGVGVDVRRLAEQQPPPPRVCRRLRLDLGRGAAHEARRQRRRRHQVGTRGRRRRLLRRPRRHGRGRGRRLAPPLAKDGAHHGHLGSLVHRDTDVPTVVAARRHQLLLLLRGRARLTLVRHHLRVVDAIGPERAGRSDVPARGLRSRRGGRRNVRHEAARRDGRGVLRKVGRR